MSKNENSLEGWQKVLTSSREQTKSEEEKWRLELGEAANTIKTEDELLGFWKINGNPDQVLVARIGKNGAIRSSAQFYNYEFIVALMETVKK